MSTLISPSFTTFMASLLSIEAQQRDAMAARFEAYLAHLNPEQLAAVMTPLTQSLQVMAGAGTGKTQMLALRAVKLLLELRFSKSSSDEALGQPFHQRLFLATFTKKAATELQARLTRIYEDVTQEKLPANLWIGTFHSLSNRLLSELIRDQHYRASLLLEDYLGEEAPALKLREGQVLEDVDLLMLKELLLERLLAEDAADLSASLQVTSLPSVDIQTLINTGFTDLPQLLADIVMTILPKIKAAGLTPEQFEAQALKQSSDYGHVINGLPLSQLFVDLYDLLATWQQHFAAHHSAAFSFLPSAREAEEAALLAVAKGEKPPSDLKLLVTHALKSIKETKRLLVTDIRKKKPDEQFTVLPDDFALEVEATTVHEKLISLVAWVYRCYQQMLVLENRLDMDDLQIEPLQCLLQSPERAKRYQAQFQHILLDEFQDTNGAQLALVQALTAGATPVTVVGDLRQSIYAFRFAQPENLEQLFASRPDVLRLALNTNYRSTPEIIRVANRASELQGYGAEHYLYPNPGQSFPEVFPVTQYALDKSLSLSEQQAAEQDWIVTEIQALLAPGQPSQTGQYDVNDIAVLFPTHAKTDALEAALKAQNIPAIRQRHKGFFKAPLFKVLVSFLSWLQEPNDDRAFVSLLQQSLSHEQLLHLSVLVTAVNQHGVAPNDQNTGNSEKPQTWSYYQVLSSFVSSPPPEAKVLYDALRAVAKQYRDLHARYAPLMPHEVIAQLQLAYADLSVFVNEDWLTHSQDELDLLGLVLHRWARVGPGKTAAQVLACLRRAQAQDMLDVPLDDDSLMLSEKDAVRLMTVHAAKGLEFPVVFIAGVEPPARGRNASLLYEPQYAPKRGFGLFLKQWLTQTGQWAKTMHFVFYQLIWQKPRERAERLRLLYVALTRAKERLYIVSNQNSFQKYLNPLFFENLVMVLNGELNGD